MSSVPSSGASIPLEKKRMNFDDVAWDRAESLREEWKKRIFHDDVYRAVGSMIIKHRRGVPEELFPPKMGAFNLIFQMKFQDGGSAIIRFPVPGYSACREEKLRREVSVMRFLERHTNIRVPHVLYYDMTEESPAGLGPFIIMEYTEHDSDICDALSEPRDSPEDRPFLDPNISPERLKSVYSGMVDILLQLAKHSFDEIGSITNNEEDEFDDLWVTTDRPWTYNMNQLLQLGNFPPPLLPQPEMHMHHLITQHNDPVESAEHCKQKYIARCLFRKLARENKLCSESTSFKLFCDDFRPANVLPNSKFNYSIVGAIDWEFCYAAPVEFSYSPPFWLLVELPEYWEQGLDNWTCFYQERLTTFLEALEGRERAGIERGILQKDQCLSYHMKASWESGDFWVTYAAKKSWAFDMIYWAKIDRRFFGDGDLDDRIKLLTDSERAEMEEFIQDKMAEKEERVLKEWPGIKEAIEDRRELRKAN